MGKDNGRQDKQGFIFLCSDVTETECLDRELFGGKQGYEKKIRNLREGDYVFLFNYSSKRLHGIFKTVSPPAVDIVPDAWSSSGEKFPWQVKVRRIKDVKSLSPRDMEHYLRFKKYPPAVLKNDVLKNILESFDAEDRLVYLQNDFAYITDDGHRVRSKGEHKIDNWLYHHEVVHAYEPHRKELGVKRCDFYIPKVGNNRSYYIEYWGKKDKKYEYDKERKKELYRKKNLNLIEIYPKDLRRLDDLLGDVLL